VAFFDNQTLEDIKKVSKFFGNFITTASFMAVTFTRPPITCSNKVEKFIVVEVSNIRIVSSLETTLYYYFPSASLELRIKYLKKMGGTISFYLR